MNSAIQSQLESAANTNVKHAIPAVSTVSAASIAVAYLHLTKSASAPGPDGAMAFSKLPWDRHAWAVMSVGLKIFDMQTDFSFFFISLRGEPFESQYMLPENETRRFTNEGRYNSDVNQIQLTAFASCVLGVQFTVLDIYGTRQRLLGNYGTPTMITLGVLLFEDIPQLIINIRYMLTVSSRGGPDAAVTNESETGAGGADPNVETTTDSRSSISDFLQGISTISKVSLVASLLNMLYSLYLLISDRCNRRQQDRNQENTESEIERRLKMQYKPTDSTFTNPAFYTSATPRNPAEHIQKAVIHEATRCKKCKAKISACVCNVRRNTADMATAGKTNAATKGKKKAAAAAAAGQQSAHQSPPAADRGLLTHPGKITITAGNGVDARARKRQGTSRDKDAYIAIDGANVPENGSRA